MKNFAVYNYLLSLLTIILVASCGGEKNNQTSSNLSSNLAPVITNMIASPVYERDVFNFTAEVTDKDGSIASYLWEQISGTTVTELTSDGPRLSFTAPNIANEEVLTFRLTVTDNLNTSTSADIKIDTLAYQGLNSLTFIDNGLSTCLKADINNDVALKDINCDGIVINSFDDLSYFNQLESISFTHAQLEDISSLSNFTQLNAINLSDNNIKDASPIAKLINLTKLTLNNNKINNINSIFSELPALKSLSLTHVHSGKYSDYPIDVAMLDGLNNLTELTISDTDVINTTSLKKLVNLQSLNISYTGTSFDSLAFLNALSNLEELTIISTYISDFSPIKSLINLKKLNLSSQLQVSNNNFNVTMLSAMTQLEELNLDYLPLTQNLSELNKHTNLTHLSLKDTHIQSIEFLISLPKLKLLNLSKNKAFNDFNFFSNLTALQELDLSDTNISNLSVISKLTALQELDLSDTNISDLSTLTKLTNLVKLNVSGLYYENGNKPLDLNSLKSLSNLEELNLESNAFINISALKYLINLQVLDMKWCQLDGLFNFSQLAKLHSLDLSHTDLPSLSGLETAINLKTLTIKENFTITDISALQNISSLTSFNMSGAYQIDDIAPLAQLTNLVSLDISFLPYLADIEELSLMTSLKELNLRYSEKINDIETLFTLPSLTEINLEGLPLILCTDLDKLAQRFPDANISRRNTTCIKS